MNKKVVVQSDNKIKTEILTTFEEQVYEIVNLAKADDTRKAILLSAILQDDDAESLLRQHYYDKFGSEGFVWLTKDKLKSVVEGIIETIEEHIEVEPEGYREYNTYANVNDDDIQKLILWVKQELGK